MRRRRFEIDLGRFLRPGQAWRSRADDTVWTVAQIHRKDCQVELRRDGERRLVSFRDLREQFKWRATTGVAA